MIEIISICRLGTKRRYEWPSVRDYKNKIIRYLEGAGHMRREGPNERAAREMRARGTRRVDERALTNVERVGRAGLESCGIRRRR